MPTGRPGTPTTSSASRRGLSRRRDPRPPPPPGLMIMGDNQLAGAVAVVTGASSGIGAATARRLAREGCAVALIGRRRRRLDDVADSIRGAGGTALVLEADLNDPDRAA